MGVSKNIGKSGGWRSGLIVLILGIIITSLSYCGLQIKESDPNSDPTSVAQKISCCCMGLGVGLLAWYVLHLTGLRWSLVVLGLLLAAIGGVVGTSYERLPVDSQKVVSSYANFAYALMGSGIGLALFLAVQIPLESAKMTKYKYLAAGSILAIIVLIICSVNISLYQSISSTPAIEKDVHGSIVTSSVFVGLSSIALIALLAILIKKK